MIEGRVWKFGDGLKSSYFFNGKYDILGRQKKYLELAQYILEDHEEGFAKKILPGDIFVIGESFGTGKHLWGPVGALRALGVQAVIAKSLSTSWERNSLNMGFASLVGPQVHDLVETGDILQFNPATGVAINQSTKAQVHMRPTPSGIRELIAAGGIAGLTSARLGITDPAPVHN